MAKKLARFVPSHKLFKYDVVNKKNEDMGQVQTFVIDMREGIVAFALVAFGGFLHITDKFEQMIELVGGIVACGGVRLEADVDDESGQPFRKVTAQH